MTTVEQILIEAGVKIKGLKEAKVGFLSLRRALISIMLTAYAVKRAMFGLLRPAFDLVGIFDMLNVTLGIVFLPIALALLDVLLPIMLFFMNLPGPIQAAAGTLVLFSGALAFLITLLAGFGIILGTIDKYIVTLPTWGTIWGALVDFISINAAALGIIFALIVVAIIGFALAWQENFGKIREWVEVMWDGVKTIFDGIKDIVKGIIDIIVGLFSGNSDKVIEGAKLLWEGVKEVFWGMIEFVSGFVVSLGLALFRAFIGLLVSIVELLGKGFGWIWEHLLVPAYEFGKNLVINIIEGIKSFGKMIWETIMGFIPESIRTNIAGMFGGTTETQTPRATSSTPIESTGLQNFLQNIQVTVIAPNDYGVNVKNGSATI